MEVILENLRRIKDHVAVISIVIAVMITFFNWFSQLNDRFERIENDISKLKIEYRNLYRSSLIRNKVRIEREIKELMERESSLSQLEREKLTELIVEREKILMEMKMLTE